MLKSFRRFGLEFHLNHEHDANEMPKKKFDVKTFITKTSSARHKKAKSKKSKKKSNQKDWDLENAWRDDDSDETDGEVSSKFSFFSLKTKLNKKCFPVCRWSMTMNRIWTS